MAVYIDIDVLLRWSNSNAYKNWEKMCNSRSAEDNKLADSISYSDPSFTEEVKVDEETSRVLEYLAPYYSKIVVRGSDVRRILSHYIKGTPITEEIARVHGWPAIWFLNKATKYAMGHGGLEDHEKFVGLYFSKGEYKNYKGKFYKKVDFEVLKYLRQKEF